jgi:hypothetical protein
MGDVFVFRYGDRCRATLPICVSFAVLIYRISHSRPRPRAAPAPVIEEAKDVPAPTPAVVVEEPKVEVDAPVAPPSEEIKTVVVQEVAAVVAEKVTEEAVAVVPPPAPKVEAEGESIFFFSLFDYPLLSHGWYSEAYMYSFSTHAKIVLSSDALTPDR